MGLLEFVFSSFWAFIGTLFLIWGCGRTVALVIVGSIAALRGTTIQMSNGDSKYDAVELVRDEISRGGMDAAIARANARNAQRRRV